MSAALKMSAPSELSSQIKKMMVFCKDNARSIKAMKHHLAVTEATTRELLAQALEQKLLWRQSNGMYKTFNTKLSLIELDAEQDIKPVAVSAPTEQQPEADSLQDLSDLDDAFEVIEIDTEMTAAIDLAYQEQQAAYNSEYAPAANSEFNLDQMQQEFEKQQNRNCYPVIDELNAKSRALQYAILLLSDGSTELKRCIEAIQMDLAVINLHQVRS
ncbi:hypothetical protein [Rheinheimera salexigens]|uniref:Uncharacterized protein n=1 Tax=Rheinheimera salexigens TaxID=1628148 RepID=A0A1E7Q844_9GAMM|nr:hypothetical protein [Rheinheimera salexigens]OEY70364.1 hypothetical protein BI198_12855 [Rheinheimera salexigens]